jgi:hypothetical protein
MTQKFVDDLLKGTEVLLAYGEQNGDLARCNDYAEAVGFFLTKGSYQPWRAVLLDDFSERAEDENGTIRLMRVYGWEEEIGDTYAHEVVAYKDEKGFWQKVNLSVKQNETRKLVESI